MKVDLLDYTYPEELIARVPQRPPRVMLVDQGTPREVSFTDLLAGIPAGDVLVINDTRVNLRRVFALSGEEILFLQELGGAKGGAEGGTDDDANLGQRWEVLFPARRFPLGAQLTLPGGITMSLVAKGRPQVVELSAAIHAEYFEKYGELPLPPYIQKSRAQRHNYREDQSWYQTAWAHRPGSFAAPTASLHFALEDLARLRARGVGVVHLTLHVGLGTFLPVRVEDLADHPMHAEDIEIPVETLEVIQTAKARGKKIWALGTTVTRALEAWAQGHLVPRADAAAYRGETRLLLQPGCTFQVVDRLLTNFHQPRSTLLALVAAFSEIGTVQRCYQWAIDRRFRLFSYGDLSVWLSK